MKVQALGIEADRCGRGNPYCDGSCAGHQAFDILAVHIQFICRKAFPCCGYIGRASNS